MVKSDDKVESETRVNVPRTEGLRCIGSVCFNPDTGKIEVELSRGGCSPSVIKGVVENIIKGAEVEFVLPREKLKGE